MALYIGSVHSLHWSIKVLPPSLSLLDIQVKISDFCCPHYLSVSLLIYKKDWQCFATNLVQIFVAESALMLMWFILKRHLIWLVYHHHVNWTSMWKLFFIDPTFIYSYCCEKGTLNKLASSVDAIAISANWNYQWLTHWLTDRGNC